MKTLLLALFIIATLWGFEDVAERLLWCKPVRYWAVVMFLVGAVGIATKRIGVW